MNSPKNLLPKITCCLLGAWVSTSHAALWHTPVTISEIEVGNVGGEYLYIRITGTVHNPAGCPASDGYVLRDPVVINHAMAVALAAHASGKPVRLWVTDTCDTINRPLISSIGVM